jgi:capsular exopolysaccharide synthesis family protein
MNLNQPENSTFNSADENSSLFGQEPQAFFSLTSGSSPTTVKLNGLATVANRTNFTSGNTISKLEELSPFPQALLRGGRTVTLDPDLIDPHLFTLQELPSPQAEQQYRRLAVNLITASARRQIKRILVASAHQGEGRTGVMLNLAGALARAKLRVLVVDSDFSHPSVMRMLGLDSKVGIAEIFNQDKQINEAVVVLRPLGISVLVTRETLDNPAEILASSEFHALLNILDHEFDFVLFDSPPLLDSADANLLSRLVDTTLLVVRPNTSTAAQMGKAVALLSAEDISGVVINRT